MKNNQVFQNKDVEEGVVNTMLKYAGFISRRGWVSNTLGNIAIRTAHAYDTEHGVIYTKHKGVSLEEMGAGNIVVTDIDGNLLCGARKPSIGHQLNREVFRHRADINAVIHVHVNEVISYFSVMKEKEMKYISDDVAFVLAKPVFVLKQHINVEKDARTVKDFIKDTNCFVMPNHGVTALGRDVSEAYHRVSSFVAETQRVLWAMRLAHTVGAKVNFVSDKDVKEMYESGEEIIYGDT